MSFLHTLSLLLSLGWLARTKRDWLTLVSFTVKSHFQPPQLQSEREVSHIPQCHHRWPTVGMGWVEWKTNITHPSSTPFPAQSSINLMDWTFDRSTFDHYRETRINSLRQTVLRRKHMSYAFGHLIVRERPEQTSCDKNKNGIPPDPTKWRAVRNLFGFVVCGRAQVSLDKGERIATLNVPHSRVHECAMFLNTFPELRSRFTGRRKWWNYCSKC